MRFLPYVIILALLIFFFGNAYAVPKMYWATCRTGGGDCLDGIDGDTINAGDSAIVVLDSGTVTPNGYFYRAYSSGTTASDPAVIKPADPYAGLIRWHLLNIYAGSINSLGATDDNYLRITNNASRAAGAYMELYPVGNLWTMNNNGTADVIAGVKVSSLGTFAAPITTNPYALAALNTYGSILYYGATGEIDLPAAVAGMSVCIYNTGAFTITIDPNSTDVIVRDGTAQAGGVSMTLDTGAGHFVWLHCDAANHWVTLGYSGTLGAGT